MQRRGTRADGHRRLLVVYSARGFLARIVCFEGATLPSKVDNCNEGGSQLPLRAHISRASCLKNPGPAEPNDILVFSARVQAFKKYARVTIVI